MKILFVPIHFNDQETTENYINNVFSLKGYDPKTVHITIIDNSKNFKKKTFENIETIEAENPGYFPGLNIALKKENINQYKFIIIGNNDLLFDNDFLSKLEEVDCDNVVISPKIKSIDGQYQNPHVINDLSKLRLLYLRIIYSSYCLFKYVPIFVKYFIPNSIRRKDELQYSHPMWISQGHGSCYVLTTKYLKLFESLPELTFLYGEEFFLQHQLKEKDLRIFYEPRLSLTHLEHSTTSKMKKKSVYINQKKAFRLESEIRKLNKKKYGYSSLF